MKGRKENQKLGGLEEELFFVLILYLNLSYFYYTFIFIFIKSIGVTLINTIV